MDLKEFIKEEILKRNDRFIIYLCEQYGYLGIYDSNTVYNNCKLLLDFVCDMYKIDRNYLTKENGYDKNCLYFRFDVENRKFICFDMHNVKENVNIDKLVSLFTNENIGFECLYDCRYK